MKKILLTVIAYGTLAGTAMAGHYAATGQGTCSACHKTNLVTQHGGFVVNVCATCHDSTKPEVVTTINSGVAGQGYSCGNCHGSQSHLDKHGDYATNFNQYKGAEPGASATWTKPSGYTTVDPAQKQYQLCLKCHSSSTLTVDANGVSAIRGPSGEYFTDVAMEVNPANKSAHPIITTLNNQSGSTTPRALASNQMKAPWTNVGNQTMQCSDCHQAGSSSKFMLVDGTSWPYRPDTGKFWTLGDVARNQGSWQTKLNCAKCHPIMSSGRWFNAAHAEDDHYEDGYTFGGVSYNGAPCVSCHVAVPHGAKRSRLIGYVTDPAPFQAVQSNGTKMGTLKGFRKTSPMNYDKENCWSTVNACDDHNDMKMTYEP